MGNGVKPGFNLADGRGYMLDRSYAAAGRLNYQFFLWRDTFGFNIHPSIPLAEHHVKIADVATGTSIWLTHVAREHPTAELYGFDISLAQAPPKQWLPANVTLETWNVFHDVPESLLERFDVVHVRLLCLVVESSDPRPILRNLKRLLKPGGYLQWDELNFPDSCVKTADPSTQTPALHELLDTIRSQGRTFWALRLAEIATDEGFEDATLYHYDDKRDLAKANNESCFLVMEEFASRLMSDNLEEESSSLNKQIQAAYQESLEDGFLFYPKVVCVARKPDVNGTANNPGGLKPVPKSPFYKRDIGPRLKPAIVNVYQTWCGLTDDSLQTRLHNIRDRAWAQAPYPCIGQWMFLLPSITVFPAYPSLLARAKDGATVLDLGCCFGQDLRLLASEGVSTEAMYATDLVAGLWELGFELFSDRDRMKAKFIPADILDSKSELDQLNGQMDIILACQFLHLFDWKKQATAMRKIVEFSRLGTVVIGYQRARTEALKVPMGWGEMYIHDLQTFREIWRQIEREMGTKWDVEASLVDLKEWGMEEEDTVWMDQPPMGVNFVITRLE